MFMVIILPEAYCPSCAFSHFAVEMEQIFLWGGSLREEREDDFFLHLSYAKKKSRG